MELPTKIFGQENSDILVESAVTTGPGLGAVTCSVLSPPWRHGSGAAADGQREAAPLP